MTAKPRIVLLYGSPHEDGVSARAAEKFIAALNGIGAEIKCFYAYQMNVHPCTACGSCALSAACIHDDAMSDAYDAIRSADGIILASPIYFSSFPGPLKNFIDRCQIFWEQGRRGSDPIPQKVGTALFTAGSEYPSMFVPAVILVRHYFNTLNCTFSEDDFVFIPNVDLTGGITPEIMINIERQTEKYLKYFIQ